jgi:Fic family protein
MPPQLWILLGEARSKCDHLASIPLRPEFADILHSVYLAKGASATTAIEGNTLKLEQVEARISGDLELPPSQEYLGQEVDNIVEAHRKIWDDVARSEFEKAQSITVEEICEFNRLVLKETHYNDYVVPGQIRRSLSVGVGKYRGAPGEDCEYLLSRYCDWLNNSWEIPGGEDLGVVPWIIKAVLAHLIFEWIHPFADGNGRVGRLIEFKILISGGVPTVAAHLFCNHYNMTRSRYYIELDRAAKIDDGMMSFLQYAVQGFVDQLVEQIDIVLFMQLDIVWRDLIYSSFQNERSRTRKRQRDLILAISKMQDGVSLREVRSLTSDLARQYATLTERTVIRDLTVLKKRGFLVQDGSRYRPNFIFLFKNICGRRPEVPVRYLQMKKDSTLHHILRQVERRLQTGAVGEGVRRGSDS